MNNIDFIKKSGCEYNMLVMRVTKRCQLCTFSFAVYDIEFKTIFPVRQTVSGVRELSDRIQKQYSSSKTGK